MKIFSSLIGLPASLILSSVVAQPAHALTSYNVSNLSSLTQDVVHDLVGTAAVGTAHRDYMPASSMSWAIGLDVGVEATGVLLPRSIRDTIGQISNESPDSVLAVVPVPKLNLHKGLPFGVEAGMSYVSYQDKIKVIGGDVKWTFTNLLSHSPVSAAVKMGYTSETLWYLKGHDFQTDFLVSVPLLFILEPYAGAGLQMWQGHIDVPTGLPASSGLPASVSGSDSGTNAHLFAGTSLKMGFFWITPEVDYSTLKVVSFGSKFSFNF